MKGNCCQLLTARRCALYIKDQNTQKIDEESPSEIERIMNAAVLIAVFIY